MTSKTEFIRYVNSLKKDKKISKIEADNLKLLAKDYAYQEWRKGALHGFAPK